MDFQFHCAAKARKCVRKSKHRLADSCNDVRKVLMVNPEYGVVVPGTDGLRKMRVHVASLNVGKSGGYRLIYKAMMVDEAWLIVLLTGYFEGDCDDLSRAEYGALMKEAEGIFNASSGDIDWEDA